MFRLGEKIHLEILCKQINSIIATTIPDFS
jgi:hypothetical protein